MASEAKIITFAEKHWSNWHRTLTKEPIADRVEIHNPQTNPGMGGMRKTAAAIQGLIAATTAAAGRMHPVGGRWSHSEVASPSGGRLIETATMNWRFRPARASLSPAYKGDPAEPVLLQCGINVSELNKWLETSLGRSLRTSGSSNGQTFVGAMTTSSHGSAVDMGALHSQVCGVQLLTGSRNLWLERSTDPIAADSLVKDLGATRAPGDDLFDAALVSLGGLGIIHAVMIRTAPIFRLEAHQLVLPYDEALKRAMNGFDFAGVNLPRGAERPYYFRAIVNPNDKRNRAYVQVMYQRPFPPGTPIDYSINGEFGPGHDIPGLVAGLLDTVPGLNGPLTAVMVDNQLKTYANRLGTWGETFDFTTPRKDAAASSMAIPQHLTTRAIELATDVYKKAPAPVVFTCRFVRKTHGLLAWQHHDQNCVFELDGLNSKRARAVMEGVRKRFDAEGIPYAQHWGKLHGLTKARVERSFGAKLDRWRKARDTFLPTPQERRTFSNAYLENIGLGA
ncbi:MAG TPA: hypothetical protein VFZ91_09715 [Allosphingosinicella sp.]